MNDDSIDSILDAIEYKLKGAVESAAQVVLSSVSDETDMTGVTFAVDTD